MQTIRAKFFCTAVTKQKHWDRQKGFLYTANFSPVIQGSPENEKYFEATPAGHVEIGTLKADYFQPGDEYYIDFTKAE